MLAYVSSIIDRKIGLIKIIKIIFAIHGDSFHTGDKTCIIT